MRFCFLDFETRWDRKTKHSLTHMNPVEYVMHRDTEIQVLTYAFGHTPVQALIGEDKIQAFFEREDWSDTLIVAHNGTLFDHMITRWRFGVNPLMWGDTLAMARPIHGTTVGGSLDKLTTALKLGKKGSLDATSTEGTYTQDWTPEMRAAIITYAKQDTELLRRLFLNLLPQTTLAELKLIDLTARMVVDPGFEVDTDLLTLTLKEEELRKRAAIHELGDILGYDDPELIQKSLMSNPMFASLLRNDLKVEPPKKISATTGKETFAFAKTDPEFLALLEHDDHRVVAAAEARLGTKSSILESRLKTFLTMAEYHPAHRMPIGLTYWGASTGRWSGALNANQQNLPRVPRDKQGNVIHKPTNALRNCMVAPKGHSVVVADLSGIELRVNHFLWKVPSSMELYAEDPEADLYKAFACYLYNTTKDKVTKDQRQFAKLCVEEGTMVLTERGEVPIERITSADKVWDGLEWVGTLGPIYKGEQDVIEYDGLIATPDHNVWVEDGRKVSIERAAVEAVRLAVSGTAREPVIVGAHGGAYRPMPATQTKRRVWDLLNCGPRARFTANGKLVSNCQLGLGYGMSAIKFRSTAGLQGVELDYLQANEAVDKWREMYAPIVDGWSKCGEALPSLHRGADFDIDPWKLCTIKGGHKGLLFTPGSCLRYPKLRREEDDKGKKQWVYGEGRHQRKLYSSLLDENIVQHLARNIIAGHALKIAEEYPIHHMVHDEIVCVVPDAQAQDCLHFMLDTMKTPPTWWPEIVLFAEGDIAKTYGAAK